MKIKNGTENVKNKNCLVNLHCIDRCRRVECKKTNSVRIFSDGRNYFESSYTKVNYSVKSSY